MSNISKENMNFLKGKFYFDTLKVSKTEIDKRDETRKILFELEDGNKIETVLMKVNYGNSIWVTTQVACNMDCNFCASGKLKKEKKLISERNCFTNC